MSKRTLTSGALELVLEEKVSLVYFYKKTGALSFAVKEKQEQTGLVLQHSRGEGYSKRFQ